MRKYLLVKYISYNMNISRVQEILYKVWQLKNETVAIILLIRRILQYNHYPLIYTLLHSCPPLFKAVL